MYFSRLLFGVTLRRWQPMKIGIVIRDFKLGGSERIALRLGNAWATTGHEVTVYADKALGEMAQSRAPNIHIDSDNPAEQAAAIRSALRHPVGDPAAMKALAARHLLPSIAEEYIQLFEQTVKSRRSGSQSSGRHP